MRTRIALALALCAAAAPLYAQKDESVYHGTGYELVLPARYRFISSTNSVHQGQPMSVYVFGNDAGGVMVIRAPMDVELNDTSLATRRAMLQLARAGMLQADEDMRLQGDPVEIIHEDRITLRTPIIMNELGEHVRATSDVSVPRRGHPTLWMLIAFRKRPGPRDAQIAARALDSFHLTGDDEAVASDGVSSKDELDSKP